MSIVLDLQVLFSHAVDKLSPGKKVLLRPAKLPEFDYQCDAALSLAKQLKKSPLEIAETINQAVKDDCEWIETSVSPPGFINIKVTNTTIEQQCLSPQKDDHPPASPQTIVVDYGSPNVAKNMHVGHLRSTVIGDAITRLLVATNHHVIRQNHLGDWGTQFGMLIEYLIKENLAESLDDIHHLNQMYQASKKRFDEDHAFSESAKQRVVKLQSGDPKTIALWQKLVDISITHFQDCYKTLGVLLSLDDIRGESFYNDMLPEVIQNLSEQGMIQESQGAKVVFLEGFYDKNKAPLPMIVQKSDGGYLYATTDLATLQFRVETLKANRLIYVTDSRQKQHFAMLFKAAEQACLSHADTQLDHVAFGTILGEDGKPFKTRSGETIPLDALIEEGKKRALQLYQAKNPEATIEKATTISSHIAIASIKYADLSVDKIKDIRFNWDQMLAFEGNTAPYLLNAAVRIHALFRKCGMPTSKVFIITTHAEHKLALKALEFEQLITHISDSLEIHHLCQYLFDLTSLFHHFYEACPINKADEATKNSRLNLCQLILDTLTKGLKILGIETLEEM